MDIEQAIKQSRSIRKFRDTKVPPALITKLLTAAQLAPSAYNAQPSKFIIIEDEDQKQKLKDNHIFRQEFIYEAPLVIVCCADPKVYPSERFEPVYSNSAEIGGEVGAVRDLAISAQNLVLMATGLGLGTCYIGLVNRNRIKEILNIPAHFVLPFVIIAGYPSEEPKPASRKELKEFLI